MTVTLTWQTIITASAVLVAIGTIIGIVVKIVRWFDHQSKQDKSISTLRDRHDDDMSAIKSEQRIIMEGLLACLQGLQEKGCNGPVTKAIEKIDKYLNEKAHE